MNAKRVRKDQPDLTDDSEDEEDLGSSRSTVSGGSLCTLFTNIHSEHNFVHYLYTIEAVHYWIYCWIRGEKARDIGSK